MTHNTNGIIYKNVLAWRGCEKLYLDQRTCDVNFVFETENGEIEKVPAHKCILSAISEVFDAMFFGPSKQDGDVKIVDSSAEAFKEFLQYFYRSTVRLTADNVAEVMNLAKQYMLNDCLNACTDFCKETLTLDNVCWGYELAILFEQDDLKKFCEQKINEHPKEIFQSNSFLICDKNLLRHILQLDSLSCEESVVFDGCLAWAKAACIQKGVDEEKMENLRAELGDLWNEIRFGKMSLECFHAYYQLYNGLFSSNEFIDIIGKIASKDSQPGVSHQLIQSTNKVLICDRVVSNNEYQLKQLNNRTKFASNCAFVLKGFVCYLRFSEPFIARARISEHCSQSSYVGRLLHYQRISINYSGETVVELTAPVTIRPDVEYSIEIELNPCGVYYSYRFKQEVRLDQGALISFFSDVGIVKCLHLVECYK